MKQNSLAATKEQRGRRIAKVPALRERTKRFAGGEDEGYFADTRVSQVRILPWNSVPRG